MRRITTYKRLFDIKPNVGPCTCCNKTIGNVSKPRVYYFLCAICGSTICLECYENDEQTKYHCPKCG